MGHCNAISKHKDVKEEVDGRLLYAPNSLADFNIHFGRSFEISIWQSLNHNNSASFPVLYIHFSFINHRTL